MLRFYLFPLFFLPIFCYKCQNDIINPSPTEFYPSDWSGGQPVPSLAPNQNCLLTVTVPTGYYANVSFYRQFDNPAGTYVIYSNNKIAQIVNGDNNPFIFVNPGFKINLQTDGATDHVFAFKITWTPIPNAPQNIIDVARGNPPVALQPNQNLTIFRGNPMVSLMAFTLPDPSQAYLLRQSAIYSGDTFIGTLDQVLTSMTPLTANKISIYTFGLSVDYPLYMASDYEDTRGIMVYEGANCPVTGDCSILLQGSWGNAMTVTDYNGTEVIRGFDGFPGTAVINVYENQVSESTRIATLTSDNYFQQIPLEVKGVMKFYELNGHGLCNMTVTRL